MNALQTKYHKSSKRNLKLKMRPFALVMNAILLLALFFATATSVAFAEKSTDSDNSVTSDSANTVILEPGSSYDLSQAPRGSNILITNSGTYNLSGSTNYAHVTIIAEGDTKIEVRLSDKTSIQLDRNLFSEATSALRIETGITEQGTPQVSLVPEANGTATFIGCLGGPGVSLSAYDYTQTGTTPEQPVLSFDGENNSTISVKGSLSPWGQVSTMSSSLALAASSETKARVAITSGRLVADGDQISYGIEHPQISCSGIEFIVKENATVEASSSGEVPIIGSIENSSSAISIEGGHVKLTSRNGGIGIGSFNKGSKVAFSISGGVYEYIQSKSVMGGHSGLALGSMDGANAEISISGGLVKSEGSERDVLIGSQSGTANVTISGGTVDIGSASIGYTENGTFVTISGGSFTGFVMQHQNSPSGSPWMTSDTGEKLYRTTVLLENANSPSVLSSLSVEGPPYGVNDIRTTSVRRSYGIVVWIAETGEVTEAADEYGNYYKGEVHPPNPESPFDYDYLYLASNLTLDVNTDFGYDGLARVNYGSSEVNVEEEVDSNEDGAELLGFYDAPEGGTMIMDAQYRLIAGAEGWINTQGEWEKRPSSNGDTSGTPFTLYAHWNRNYMINFDTNTPQNASTTPSGSMEQVEANIDETISLPRCAYSLPGYQFTGWNTEANGTGTSYSDLDNVTNLAEAGETVTLYAQWKPLTYRIVFEAGNGATGSMEAQTFTFDQGSSLNANAFNAPKGAAFAGWYDPQTEKMYSDLAQVFNLCEINEAGNLIGHTLIAQWTSSSITLVITKDNKPVTLSNPENSIILIPENGETPTTGFSQGAITGSYVLSSIEPGTYYVDINETGNGGSPLPTGDLSIVVEAGKAATLAIEYATVKVETEGDGIGAWVSSANVAERTVLVGDKVSIGCGVQTENGYLFNGWSYQGVTPADFDSKLEEQVISVEGIVTLVAHSRTASYTIVFDANGGEGEMASQAVACHETQMLNPCSFRRSNFAFVGWNTKADGSGTSYADEAEITNLASQDGAEITLYAQWAPRYTIAFNANTPLTASTTTSGTTPNLSMIAGQTKTLPSNGYALPGYQFTEWNTKADGSGTAYDNKAEVINLSSEAGTTVTLYAQWKPRTYSVNLLLNNDESEDTLLETLEATFDEPFTLPDSVLGIPEGSTLLGWETLGLGSFYNIGSSITNLCTFSADGTPVGQNLYARLGTTDSFYLVIKNNGSPVSLENPTENIALIDASGTEFRGFFEEAPGTYALATTSSSGGILPPGTYSVSIAGWDTTDKHAVIENNETRSLTLEYFTVEVIAESPAQAWLIDPATSKSTNQLERVPQGSSLTIGATTEKGYSFESWTAIDCMPTWEENDPTRANQTITVNDKTLLEAQSIANRYQIAFDPNGGTGKMAKQDMVYDQPQNLASNTFTRENYAFVGWNTQADGSGTSYANSAEIINLASDHEAEITLYAQWAPCYTVSFNANTPITASTSISGSTPDLSMITDQAKPLPSCGYKLPGYQFIGWNTQADGSGTFYANEAEVNGLAEEAGITVSLYAQWKPLPYTVKLYFTDNNITTLTGTIDATFDEPFFLPDTVSNLPEGNTLLGWETLGLGSFYPAGQEVKNLCSLSDEGIPEGSNLYAVLKMRGMVYLSIINDGTGVDLDPSAITLISNTTEFQPFQKVTSGLYSAEKIPEGFYQISIEGWETDNKQLSVSPDGTGSLALEYFTIAVTSDEHSRTWITEPLTGENLGTKVERCLKDSNKEVTIHWSTDKGYSFSHWSHTGTEPDWSPTLQDTSQTIAVNGAATLKVNSTPHTYQITFDPNGGQGTMSVQDMTYDKPQNLTSSTFTREGYQFVGWNTKADGSGSPYANEAEVLNLTTNANEVITLYAQWEEDSSPSPTNPDNNPDTDENPKITNQDNGDNSKDSTPSIPLTSDKHLFFGIGLVILGIAATALALCSRHKI